MGRARGRMGMSLVKCQVCGKSQTYSRITMHYRHDHKKAEGEI